MRRRFTLPWWTKEQRRWAGDLLTGCLIRAQLLADTFHDRWQDGIHVGQIKSALRDAAVHDERLAWMVLTEPSGGVLEALAAASARVWNDSAARNVMLVVDVGAGTTDLSLFWVVQRADQNGQPGQFHRAWPIAPCGNAIRQAGDQLDSLLVDELLRKADLGADKELQRRVSNNLFLRGVRRLKERLFETGEITEVLVSDHTVRLTREEFVSLPKVRAFEDRIRVEVQKLLDGIDGSWEQAAGDAGVTLVLTGGGCRLPMIRSLKDKVWTVGTRPVECRLAPELPGDVAERFSAEFIREYPEAYGCYGRSLEDVARREECNGQVARWGTTAARLGAIFR